MKLINRYCIQPFCVLTLFAILSFGISHAQTAPAQSTTHKYPNYPSETPDVLKPSDATFDYERREVMIPMRDGVRLHTVILVPRTTTKAHPEPILLTRTPYSADELTTHAASSHLGPTLWGYDNATEVIVEGGYVRVVQDVRGKYGSEGDYVMNRPLHGPLNPTPVDHSTDTYDTIDWLVKNVPECDGKVGILGISYDGFLPLMALVNPHPALKVSIPMNPMVDGWRGDDWFHNGAFRAQNLPYIYEQVATRKNDAKWWSGHFDDYDLYMEGSAGEIGKVHGLDQIGFWRKVIAHPSYDSFWQDQAMDKILAAQPIKIPVMLVDSLWDQEDIYGAMAVYKALKPKDKDNKVFLVIGPWHHGQEIEDGSTLGALKFNSDTGLYFREEILKAFLDQYLKGEPGKKVAPVSAFETGTNTWRFYNSWPPSDNSQCQTPCVPKATPLYLTSGLKLSFDAPKGGSANEKTGANGKQGSSAYEEYVSDPAKPVPFRTRPIRPVGYDIDKGFTWALWLVDDQREFSGRPDVLAFTSDVLTQPLKISGQPIANLVASTSGTDSDWVVKLIDVYPDEVAGQERMGGYQLAVAMDIFRGRYRESLETPKPITADKPLVYRFELPTTNHVFLPGHRIMVQVQSSWFPLYDRNPQTFVPNIFWAKPEDYKKATQRIFHEPGSASFVELPLVK
ncbi:MAG TPA: CocE/NonD family hydrolase [Candidatus Angelobacter sp.]|nr:CocE/NonD family hydrolase [Candidatus Angelobacter sp.]